MKYFISAIGTDSGKTLVSAIFCKALQAAYWKPIQAGFPTDSEQIKKWQCASKILKELYVLNTPASPHAAAKIDGVDLKLDEFMLPEHDGNLIVEGAGGLMVPINDNEFIVDLINQLRLEVVLVCNLYLGSINHSILSIEALKSRNIPIKGIVFNGESNSESESIILKHAQTECLLRIPKLDGLNDNLISMYADLLKSKIL